jgi:hypothetical protein
VLGMEHNVGPVDGSCVTEIYGWNFADSMFPQCSFGGVATRAEIDVEDVLPGRQLTSLVHSLSPQYGIGQDAHSYRRYLTTGLSLSAASLKNFHTAKCTTPGHVSPRFVDVGFSNDGVSFTNFTKVGKTVKHLFLESSLYTTGMCPYSTRPAMNAY